MVASTAAASAIHHQHHHPSPHITSITPSTQPPPPPSPYQHGQEDYQAPSPTSAACSCSLHRPAVPATCRVERRSDAAILQELHPLGAQAQRLPLPRRNQETEKPSNLPPISRISHLCHLCPLCRARSAKLPMPSSFLPRHSHQSGLAYNAPRCRRLSFPNNLTACPCPHPHLHPQDCAASLSGLCFRVSRHHPTATFTL
jgi:hypothetical protein